MAKWTIASYNRFIGASHRRYGLSLADARQHYREMRGTLGRPIFRSDLRTHPRIAQRMADRAQFARRFPPPAPPPAPPEEEAIYVPPEVLEELDDDREIEFSEESP